MDMTIDQQVALDEALVPHTSRLRIGKRNFRLRSYITSNESTLQLVYDVLRLTPFYKAFLVTADVSEIYILEYFREMLHICPRLPGQTFDELPFKEEILAFLSFLGHSGEITKLTDVNINKSHQPWRTFAAVINKCLSGKSTGYDRLWLSQAQILWGMYHTKNVNFAYPLWEDFVHKVEHKDANKSNEMYYPRFIKVIIHYFMTKDPSIPRRNKVEHKDAKKGNEMYYPRFTKVIIHYFMSKDPSIPRRNKVNWQKTTTSAKGKQPAKASKANSLTVLSEVAMTEAEQLKLATKRSPQQTHISQASGSGVDEGTGIIPGIPDIPTEESDEEIFWKSSDEEDDDDDDVDEGSDDQDDDDAQDDDDEQD
nr:hypothetical protein [Tanacetum cinerariifolium]